MNFEMTRFIYSCKSNYDTIMTMTAPFSEVRDNGWFCGIFYHDCLDCLFITVRFYINIQSCFQIVNTVHWGINTRRRELRIYTGLERLRPGIRVLCYYTVSVCNVSPTELLDHDIRTESESCIDISCVQKSKYSEYCLNQTSLRPSFVFTIDRLNLTKISYIGTLFIIHFMQVFHLFTVLFRQVLLYIFIKMVH